MSDFTTGLMILGAVLLAALAAWNTWTSRRNTPRQPEAQSPAARTPDRAERAERSEPVFDTGLGNRNSSSSSGGSSSSAGATAVTGASEATPAGTDATAGADIDFDLAQRQEPLTMPMPLLMPEKKPGLDALIDVIAPIVLEAPVSGDTAQAAMPTTRRAGSKPFAIEGLNEATQHWETPHLGRRYGAFQAGVQLANRTGALNEIEYSEFVMKVQAFADAVNGSPDFPEMHDEVARARELDHFAGGHDAQLSFTLRAKNAAWSPGYVQQNAARLGFLPGPIPGRMVLPADLPGSPPVLSLSFDTQAAMADDPALSAIRDLTLSVDVPQVHRVEQPFARMRDVATALASAMDGVVSDDNGQLIRDEGLDVVGADLESLYDTLDARDLAAGSPQARRLFS